MQNEIIQSMHDQVRAIYRALTGEDVVETEPSPESSDDTDANITRRFAELEVIARSFPSVMERISPFTFRPPLDVIAGDGAVVLEVALCGVDRDAIAIERVADALVISGIRSESRVEAAHVFHAEIPRGPFYRSIPLPFPLDSDPRVELDRGVLRIYLTAAKPGHGDSDSIQEPNRKHTGEGHDEDGDQ